MPEKIFDLTAPVSRSAGDAAAELVREAILDGRLLPGQRLKEGALASDLGISRTPVREALRLLETEGLVASLRNRGTFVRDYSADDIRDIYEIRALLETQAARRAAERCTPADHEALRASCERFERSDADTFAFNRENLIFHATILRISGSERLTVMARTVIELPLMYTTTAFDADDVRHDAQAYHRRLTDAIGGRQPDRAADLMAEHVLQSRDLILQSLRSADRAAAGG